MSMWRRGKENFSRGRPARLSALCAAFAAIVAGVPAGGAWGIAEAHGSATMSGRAVLDLKRGDTAPPFSLMTTAGTEVSLASLQGRTVILQFAEAGHERSQQAMRLIARALQEEALQAHQLAWVVIYTRSSDPEVIEQERASIRGATVPIVIHDTERAAFGAYEVVVLPSAAIIDSRGKVVHAMAGLGHPTARFGQTVSAALLLGAGEVTDEEFDQLLNGPAARDDELQRAERLMQMGRRLAERGQYEAAESQFLEALDHAPDLVAARLGLADLLIRKGRHEEARTHTARVLDLYPRSLEAATLMAHIHVLRAERHDAADELSMAEAMVRDVLERSPRRPRAYYILGLVHEQRGETIEAASAYRRASELLMDRPVSEDKSIENSP